jgi:hypothetical protein
MRQVLGMVYWEKKQIIYNWLVEMMQEMTSQANKEKRQLFPNSANSDQER